ncbi:MAG: DUF1573 domain-containing protein [Bacteroidia bacterium]|nr:DUF1573 domain-containing protein [Bacteroidia bacterium]
MRKTFSIYWILLLIALGFSGCMDETDDEDIAAESARQEVVEGKQPQSVLVAENPVDDNLTTEAVPTEAVSNAKDKQKSAVKETPKTEPVLKTSAPVVEKTASKTKATTEMKEKIISPVEPVSKSKGKQEISAVTPAPSTTRGNVAEPVTNVRGITPTGPKVSGIAAVMNHEEYDFKDIREGDKVKHTFVLKNIGTQDVFIQDVDAGCSCTTADYSFESIPPGGSTPIEITFNSDTKIGTQLKKISIVTNAGTKVVKMTGTVFPKDKKY